MAPYEPASYFGENISAENLDLDLSSNTNVFVFPIVSGFVGGDTVGAVISEWPHERDEVSLIVDIGTNGELVLGNSDGLWATSCATGPALEGAHISCGMWASPGAIHKVVIDPDTYIPDYETLGGENPLGICGSGIVDAVAGMLRAGILLPTGRFKEGMPGVIVDDDGIGRSFTLVPKEETALGQPIEITLADIRQVQLAKAALLVGMKYLMNLAGITKVDRVVETGASGSIVDWESAVVMGMLPEWAKDADVHSVENAAGNGAMMALMDTKYRNEAKDLANKIQFIELADEPDFNSEFPNNMTFPE